jgi:hypothetical protein
MARSHVVSLFRAITARGRRTGGTSNRAHFKSVADTSKTGACQSPLALITRGDIESSTNLHDTLEASTHVAVWAATLLQTVDAESALALRDQGGGNRLTLVRLHLCAVEQKNAALAAQSALSHTQIHA